MTFQVKANWQANTIKFDLEEADDGRTAVQKAKSAFERSQAVAMEIFSQTETAHIRVEIEEKVV